MKCFIAYSCKEAESENKIQTKDAAASKGQRLEMYKVGYEGC